MTDEKRKPDEEEVDEEQLEEVEGGVLERFPNVPLKEEPAPEKSMEREGTIENSA